LEKDRNRRYETANGLAADLKRHLSNEPVIARPPSAAYRFQKLVRRHKLQFAAAAFALIVLLLAVAVSSWQAVRASREQRAAKEQAAIARSVKDFLIAQLLGTANPFIVAMPDPNRRPLLDRIAGQVEGRFTNQPLIEAEIRSALGDAFTGLGDFAEAAGQFEKCLTLRGRVLDPLHSERLEALAAVAQAYIHLDRLTDAQKLLTDPITAVRNSPLQWTRGAGWLFREQGYLFYKQGRAAEAEPYLKDAVAVLKRTLDPKDPRRKNGIGEGLLALATYDAGQPKEAEVFLAKTIEESQRDYGADAPLTALYQRTQAYFFLRQQRPLDALPLLEQALATLRTIGTNNPATLEAEFFLAQAYEQKGDAEKAAKLFGSLHGRWAKYFPNDTARGQCRRIAQFFVRQRQFDEVKAVYGPLRESFGANPPERPWEFEMLIEATAATKGWPAVAELWRKNFDRSSDSMAVWLDKAWIFRYVGDADRDRQVVTKVLALAPTLTSTNDKHVPVEIAALGPFQFSADQVNQL